MRVLISGGGTGGHIYPALAVATFLRDNYQADILYLGSDDGLETELVPAAGFRIATVKAGKLPRYISWNTVKAVSRVPIGITQAVKIVREFQPQVTFTSGGYVAVPAGLAARLNGVPLVIHQQDVPPNLSNKLIGPLATRISIAFADSQRYFPAHKTLLLGNPLRQPILDVRQILPAKAREQLGFIPEMPLLLVTGGSQGARHLNQVVVDALPDLLKYYQVLQISGSKLFDETRIQSAHVLENVDPQISRRYRLEPYMSDDMPLALQAADLVVCRAGAATLSELALLGKPCVLVPLPPTLGGSPQEVNAAMFERFNAATVVRNTDLQPTSLIEAVKNITLSPDRLLAMTEAARSLAQPDATQRIAETVIKMAKGSVAVTQTYKGVNS